jgi:hypothetical protein
MSYLSQTLENRPGYKELKFGAFSNFFLDLLELTLMGTE